MHITPMTLATLMYTHSFGSDPSSGKGAGFTIFSMGFIHAGLPLTRLFASSSFSSFSLRSPSVRGASARGALGLLVLLCRLSSMLGSFIGSFANMALMMIRGDDDDE